MREQATDVRLKRHMLGVGMIVLGEQPLHLGRMQDPRVPVHCPDPSALDVRRR